MFTARMFASLTLAALVLSAAAGQPEAPKAPAAPTAPAAPPAVTLELIMSDPDWIGRAPENPYWSDDGREIYFRRKREGSTRRDLFVVPIGGGEPRLVEGADLAEIPVEHGDWDDLRTRKVFSRSGDLFIYDTSNGWQAQLTRTSAFEHSPRFMADGMRIAFVRDGATLVRHLVTGLEEELFRLEAADDPLEEKVDEGYLAAQQRRLFDVLRERRENRDENRRLDREQQQLDLSRPPVPWYLGKDTEIVESVLSPDGRWVAVRLTKKGDRSGKSDTMPNYVTESGYVDTRSVRAKVGTPKERPETLVLLDLESRTRHDIDLSTLPGLNEDPLAEVTRLTRSRKQDAEPAAPEPVAPAAVDAAAPGATPPPTQSAESSGEAAPAQPAAQKDSAKEKDKAEEPKPRSIWVPHLRWTDDGGRLAILAATFDNKDIWLASIDLESKQAVPVNHARDDAWINWGFAAWDWLGDGRRLWFLSEQSGFANLYLHDLESGQTTPLVTGAFEVSDVHESPDWQHLYFLANRHHPGEYEVFCVSLADGTIEQLTALHGLLQYSLSPTGEHLLLTASTTTRPPELFVQEARPGAAPVQITHCVSGTFASIDWVEPRIVEIPTPGGTAYARLYEPAEPAPTRPAVIFIHGAGYLQNAHKGWSYYFREFMFHTLLARRGYVVLDMDYRASAGYGRDWRTAIYRRMGTPELEDLAAGADWLVANCAVARDRIGCYGGSYGGFLTLMALFTRPDLFACGAALRPVTDWAHYNQGYTSNILNTPEVDPEAFEVSSPIEFASGLAKPLLICHGMQDDNVFYQDTVRLQQRLIELGKENWEVASYPLEGHGFTEPSSWLDEYRRIYRLFEMHLRSP